MVLKQIIFVGLSIVSCAFLMACAPYVNAGNQNMVTVFVPSEDFEGQALNMADSHCAQFGRTANLKKSHGRGSHYYDYACVK